MKTVGKRTALLSTLVLPVLLTGCKSKPIEASPSASETRRAIPNFVGLWEYLSGLDKNDVRSIYRLMDANQWVHYIVRDAAIIAFPDRTSYNRRFDTGTYRYKAPYLYMNLGGLYAPGFDGTADGLARYGGEMNGTFDKWKFKFEGGVLKNTYRPRFYPYLLPNCPQDQLIPVPVDDPIYKLFPENWHTAVIEAQKDEDQKAL